MRISGKPKNWMRYLFAFLIPAAVVTGVMIYLGIAPFGDTSILIWDAHLQFKDYYGYLWDVLHGNASLQYSAGKSLGGRMIGIYGFYMSSPLNLIIYFFDKSQIAEFVAILTIIRIGLSGLTSHIYLTKRFRLQFLPAICFSMSYALMEYNIYYCRNIMWMDGVIMLPLVALGVWKVVQRNKDFWVLWLSVAVAIICNWYTGYMVCIFSGFYFLYELLLCYRRDTFRQFKRSLQTVGCYVGSMLGGVLTSCVILLPALLSLVNGKATHNSVGLTGGMNFDFIHFFSGLDISALGNKSTAPVIYCGAILVFFAIYYFADSRRSIKERLLTGVFLLFIIASFCFKDLELLWTAFVKSNSYSFRFSFLFVFLCMVIAAQAAVKIQESGIKKNTAVWALHIIILGGIILKYRDELQSDKKLLAVYFCAIVVYFILLRIIYTQKEKGFANLHWVKRVSSIALCVLLVFELAYNTKISFSEYNVQSDLYADYTVLMEDVIAELNESETGFYRLEKDVSYLKNIGREVPTGESLLYGYNSIEHYSSAYDEQVDLFLAQMGYSDWTDGSVFLTETYWNSPIILMDSILSITYTVMDEDSYGYEEYSIEAELPYDESYSVYKNIYALPLGFNISSETGNVEYTKNPYINQELFVSELIGEDISIYTHLEGVCQTEEGSQDEVWVFEVTSDGPVYIYVDGSDIHGNAYADNCALYIDGEYVQGVCQRFLMSSIYLGEYEAGEEITVQIHHNNSETSTHSVYVAQLNAEEFEQCISQFQANSESDLNVNGNVIEGTYTTQEDTTMFLSIPYEEGWTAYVDGEKVEIKEILGIFMGIELSSGEHEIYMVYSTPGLQIGILCTILGIIALILLLVVIKYRRGKVERNGE